MWKGLASLLTVWALLLSVLSPALAQAPDPGINLQISPLPIELNAKPGTSASADLRVRNAGSKAERLKAVIKTFTVTGTTGQVEFADPGPSDEFVKWITLSRPVFDAPPGEWQTIKMTVNLPKDAAFGYYWAVQFQRETPVKPQPGTTGIEGAVAIFVLLNAEAPGAVRKAEVVSFTADRKFYEFLPADFKVQVKNSGNVHFAPSGNIFIRRGKSQVGTISVNSGQGKVLPGASRVFSASWNDGFPKYVENIEAGKPSTNDKGQVNRKLQWNIGDAEKLRFGHYTADMVLIYNDGQRDIPISASVSFWVVPWRILIGLAVVAIFVFIGLWSTFKKSSRAVRKFKKGADEKSN